VGFKDPNAHFRFLDVCCRVVLIDPRAQGDHDGFRLRQDGIGWGNRNCSMTHAEPQYGEDFE
jgi:hypothetical protein